MHPFDIKASRFHAWLASAAAIALLLPAAGQLLDTTLEDLVEQDVAEQVEEDVAEALEEQVESGVTEQIETSVQSAVEQIIESEVVDAVQAQVESGVVDTVQQQVESGVVSTIAEQLEHSVAGEIGEQPLDAVEGEIDDVVEDLGDAVGGVADGAAELGSPLDGTQQPAADRRSERFVGDVDALGRSLESEVWIILVPTEHAERIPTWGFTIRERQDLATLDRVLLRVAAPEDREIAQAALELALDAPGTEVDFNHVYRPGEETTATGMPAVDRNTAPSMPAPALSIGIIDTAVAVDHDALRRADVVQRDFVPFAAERPTAHGTAVASILVGDAAKLHAQLRGARVYAASVFFADEDGNDASTAASLTVAGAWLAAQGVRVINMSLAGPSNRVLEAAIAALVERGIVVVAAVGNNGPSGAPLYPAAYPHVVGVTAIDSAKRIYRYANRGPHVAFAALGVDVRVARSGGGYRELSGTSVAAPHAAAIIVRTIASRDDALSSATVVAELKSSAQDLGAKDFDDTFGFGLIEPLEAVPVTASR
jgi:subtilisin family serine protease